MKYFNNFKRVQFDIKGDGNTQLMTDFFTRTKINPKIFDNVLYYSYYDIRNGERPDIVSQKIYGTPNYHWTFGLVNPWLIDIRKDWPMSNYELNEYIDNKYANSKCAMISDTVLATTFHIGEEIQGLASNAKGIVLSKDVNLGYMQIKVNSGNFQNGELIYGLTTSEYMTVTAFREFKYAPHHYELTSGEVVDRFTLGAQEITNYDYELNRNDNNIRIKFIKPEYIRQVVNLFEKMVK